MTFVPYPPFIDWFLALPAREQAGWFVWPSLQADVLSPAESALLQQVKPSGLVLFKRNLTTPTQSSELITACKNLASRTVPGNSDPVFPIIAIDEEGGRVSRLPFPDARGRSALSFVEANDVKGLQTQVERQCQYARQLGISCLLAPVADILTSPQNQVMGDRCFGREASTAAYYAQCVHHTIRDQGLLSCAKHFPGHGNTTTDSHTSISTSDVSLQTLQEREWVPFVTLIQDNIPLIMAAHVHVPQLDAHAPATISKTILTTYLREELGFQGLILSDDLRMNAVALHYGTHKIQDAFITDSAPSLAAVSNDDYLKSACVDALQAGCDILLSCRSIVDELIIIDTISEKLRLDKNFQQELALKAHRIYHVLGGNFGNH